MKYYHKTIIFLSAVFTLYISTAVNCTESDEHRKNLVYLQELEKAAAASVLLNNSKNILPLKKTDKGRIVCVNIDSDHSVQFNGMLNRYAQVSSISLAGKPLSAKNLKDLDKKISKFRTVIILATDKPFADPAMLKFISNNQKKYQFIFCITGDRSILNNLNKIRQPVIITGINSGIWAGYAAQVIFGGAAISSKLEAPVSDTYPAGAGDSITPVRLKYTVPEEAGINIEELAPIDEIVKDAIDVKATPGAVVMIVKDGKVIFEKAYGAHTYDGKIPVRVNDIYDLASITKAAAATISIMRLYEQGRIKLDSRITSYIPETRRTDKKNITVKELMVHEAGLPASISFGKNLKSRDYRVRYSSAYNVKVADGCYMKKNYYKKNMWPRILKAPLGTKGEYLYSDISMYFIKEVVERQSKKAFDSFLYSNFYNPLGLQTVCFNPREKFPAERIVPTEVDTYFRNTTLQGYVHDQCAAMMGGVAGHAGLFSDANDLAVLFQMLLNGGQYGGTEFFKKETVETFTAKSSDEVRRTLGFDGWDPESKIGYPSFMASRSIFGHTGFTGTCVWADPDKNLIYIFLSNRTYPNTGNKLAKMNVRSRILDVIYMAIPE